MTETHGAAGSAFAVSLDDIFHRQRARQPDAVALIDPSDKQRVTGGMPTRLTFAEADRLISSIAATFRDAGLVRGAIVAVQLPNTIEAPLTILAGLRAGLVMALIPQLWREAELTEALNRLSAHAIVTFAQIDGVQHASLAMNAAVGAFTVRHVFAFGYDCPDGVTPLNAALDAPQSYDADRSDPTATAIITFDIMSDGPRVVPRNHLQILAGGLAVLLESGLPQGASLLSSILPASFAGIVSGLMAWLLSGGSLTLHHPADLDALRTQLVEEKCGVLVVPSAVAMRLDRAKAFADTPSLRHVIALWRAPDEVAGSANWSGPHAALTDIYVFGEAGLFGAARGQDGAPAEIKAGRYGAPRSVPSSSPVGETLLTARRTLALRGAMVAVGAYDAPEGGAKDVVDTQYSARIDPASGALRIMSPPAGVFAVGGYRFIADDLQTWSERLGQGAHLTALPDALNGQRLAGHAPDRARARSALSELGLNPLMIEAFRDRPVPAA
jgi:acyl-CoA synthetase (AMP-forming)/AMP-acid ligase II